MSRRRCKRRMQIRHTRRRLRERFAIHYSAEQVEALALSVQAARGNLIGTTGAKSVWRMVVEGQPMLVVYDPRRSSVVTVMPADWRPTGLIPNDKSPRE